MSYHHVKFFTHNVPMYIYMCVPLSLVCAKPRLAGSILCFTRTAVMFDKTDYHYTFGQLATIEYAIRNF